MVKDLFITLTLPLEAGKMSDDCFDNLFCLFKKGHPPSIFDWDLDIVGILACIGSSFPS
jgi:hypothetical protein